MAFRRPYEKKLKPYRLAIYGAFIVFVVFVMVCILAGLIGHLRDLKPERQVVSVYYERAYLGETSEMPRASLAALRNRQSQA